MILECKVTEKGDNMRIEEYNNHPISRIIAIDNEAVKDFYLLIKDVYSQKDLYDIDEYYKDGGFFIGSDQEVIGTCGFIPIDKSTVELKRLRISEEYRNKGYGSKILKYVEAVVASKGYNKIILNTSSLREGTLVFYEKHNYIVVGEEKFGNIKLINFEKVL